MKKLLTLFLICAIVCACFVGCGKKIGGTSGKGLQFDEKYYRVDFLNDDKVYEHYIFHSDGTGERRYYYSNSRSEVTDYTMSFIFTYVDKEQEAIAFFYDGVEYSPNHNSSESPASDYHGLFTVGENVIMNKGGIIYVNENYLDELPNFAK